MDKIKDESPDVQKATITFFGENGPIEAEKSENDDDLQTIDWNKHPPMVKIDSRKYLTQQSPSLSERRKTISHGISLAGLVLAIAVIWSLMLIPQLCYFQVGVCQQGSTNGQVSWKFILTYVFWCLMTRVIHLHSSFDNCNKVGQIHVMYIPHIYVYI